MAGDETKLSNDKKPERLHPVDRGWSWVIMIAAFGVHLMSMGYERSFGMLYVEFQSKYNTSASMTSAINGAKAFVYCITTMLAMNFAVKKISVRLICFTGCLFQFTGVTASSFVPNSVYLIVTQGILYGCGQALVYCPSLLLLNQYFERRRPIAVTIASCGSCVGGIVFPYLTSHLMNSYGLQGTLLLLASMLLQQLICIAVYTPPEDYTSADQLEWAASVEEVAGGGVNTSLVRDPGAGKEPGNSLFSSPVTRQASEDIAQTDVNADCTFPPTGVYRSKSHSHIPPSSATWKVQLTKHLKQSYISKSHHALPMSSSKHGQHCPGPHQSHRFHENQKHISNSRQTQEALKGPGIDQINASMPSLLFHDISDSIETSHPQHHRHQHHHHDNQRHRGSLATRTSLMTFDMGESKRYQEVPQTTDLEDQSVQKSRSQSVCKVPSVMRLGSFWLLCLFFVCGVVGTGHPAVFIPPLTLERGLTEQDASFFLMVSSFAEGFGRLIPGLILHFDLMRPSTVIVFPILACAVAYHLTSFFTQFSSLMAFTLIYGLLNSCFWSLQTLIVIEVLGLDKLASAIGFYAIFMGMSSSVAFPVAGALKDITGTYSSSFHFFGALYFIAAAALIGVHVLERKNVDDGNHSDNVKDDNDNMKDKESEKYPRENSELYRPGDVNVDKLNQNND